jgi:hypothetical protein
MCPTQPQRDSLANLSLSGANIMILVAHITGVLGDVDEREKSRFAATRVLNDDRR